VSADLYPFHRYAVIHALAKGARRRLGRTALMKLLFFLQEVKRVPLGYDFTLYSYGPFDAGVLTDLGMAEQLGAVDERPVLQSQGYGYEITPGKSASYVLDKGKEFVERYRESIAAVLQEFGGYRGSQLELLSTMVFVDREAAQRKGTLTAGELVRQTLAIKPKYTPEQARVLVDDLFDRGALKVTQR
jgi:uncharacterized protein YwgA